MKSRYYLVALMIALGVATSESCDVNRNNSAAVTPVASQHVDDSGTLMDLFLGMDWGDNGYSRSEPRLENLPGVAKQELEATWYMNTDDFYSEFPCSMGIYLDTEYPSEAVFKRVEGAIDTLLVTSLGYYEELDERAAMQMLEANKPQNAQQVMDFGKRVFELYTSQMKAVQPASAYDEIPEARVCIVGHKVYDKGNWATYIVEMSFSYNGSNGCPSFANFYTIDKKTGEILTPDDIINKYGTDLLKRELWNAYQIAKDENGFGDFETSVTQDVLLHESDGCALINEGLMFYYLPYHIGCGAEGEYNLVLDMK